MGAFDRDVTAFFDGVESDVKKRFVALIRNEVEKIESADKPSSRKQWIDGKKDAPIDSVSAYGRAYFEFLYLNEIVAFASKTLLDLSPVMRRKPKNPKDTHEPGRYKAAHSVYVDGDFVGLISPDVDQMERLLTKVPSGATVTITNFVQSQTGPGTYARRLEIGHLSPQAPNGVYEPAVAVVRQRYDNLADVQFAWVGVIDAAISGSKAANKADVRFPAMIIQMR